MKPKRLAKGAHTDPATRQKSPEDEQLKALVSRARQLGQTRTRVAEAVEVNSRILELDPQSLPALTRRGFFYLKLDDYSAAKKDFTHALQLYPASSFVAEALKKIDRGWDAALKRARGGPAEDWQPVKKSKPRRAKSRRQIAEEASWSREARDCLAEGDKERRRADEAEARKRAVEEASRRTEKELRALEELTGFEEIYALGVASSKAAFPNYAVSIAAFKKAYRLDPRRKVSPGRKPNPGLFEVPTRLAAAYRLNGQLCEAQKTYEWVLEHHDSRFARVGLAAVHEDNRQHVQALRLYDRSSTATPATHTRYAVLPEHWPAWGASRRPATLTRKRRRQAGAGGIPSPSYRPWRRCARSSGGRVRWTSAARGPCARETKGF